MKKLLAVSLFTLSSSLFTIAEAQYNVLLNFNRTNGNAPSGSLALAGSQLFGMTFFGGAHNDGCVFSVDTNGTNYKDILDFNGTNGANPFGSLIISGNVLYSMTYYGGLNGDGCVFSIDTNGSGFRDLWDFNGLNGNGPKGSLTLCSNGTLFGMTYLGGLYDQGCVFSIHTNGADYEDLLDFKDSLGANPYGSLTLAGNKLYGMTSYGGANNMGCVFTIDTAGGSYIDMLDFNGSNGADPYGDLTLSGTNLYGMTALGGMNTAGCIFKLKTTGGGYQDIHDFSPLTGDGPQGSLKLSSGGLLCGMTAFDAVPDSGCIFTVDTDGAGYKDIHDFSHTTGGARPYGSLTLSGTEMYGMTNAGGTYNDGVIFKMKDVSLGINQWSVVSGQWSVYPNPSTGIFTIQSTVVSGKWSVEVYNVLGENVLTETLRYTQGDNLINLCEQSNGVYFYRVVAEDGSVIGKGKLVIQR